MPLEEAAMMLLLVVVAISYCGNELADAVANGIEQKVVRQAGGMGRMWRVETLDTYDFLDQCRD